jgi:hypothetical protein
MHLSKGARYRPRSGQNSSRVHRTRYPFESTIQRILADRSGQQTWGALERLEQRADREPLARQALCRLEALHTARELVSRRPGAKRDLEPRKAAESIDNADEATQHQVWKQLFRDGVRGESMAVLRHSRHERGWSALGLPPCFHRQIGPVGSVSLEHPGQWKELVETTLRRRVGIGSEDPRVKEYRRLFRAHQDLESGRYQGKVSQCALYLDLKKLEQTLLPAHIAKAKETVRGRLLGDRDSEHFHPQSRARRFLGSLSTLPSKGRERHFYLELSRVALSKPEELPFYASLIQEEIRRCPGSFSTVLLPKFRKALGEVRRNHSAGTRPCELSHTDCDLQKALMALRSDRTKNRDPEDGLEIYRSGLTINGYTRNYTYF